jgi:SSS family transporter
MNPGLLTLVLLGYFLILFWVSRKTAKGTDNQGYFVGNRNSTWWLVAFGMIGTSLSGVTFVSVPGGVAKNGFTYMMVVLGYFLGYFAVAYILLPLYYRLQLTSIYDYLNRRFGLLPYRTGAIVFIISRTIGATARLYLVISILQFFIFDALGIPFIVTSLLVLLMILAYTFKGGVKTIVWTDTLQTSLMLFGLISCVYFIVTHLPEGLSAWERIEQKQLNFWINSDPLSAGFWAKHLLGGFFVTIAMTGLDQEMMQKNISVKTLKDSQKNMLVFAFVLLGVNFLFVYLGGLLTVFTDIHQINATGDALFPTVALQYLPSIIGLIFLVALISALFPSADGAITALTASFCIDLLDFNRKNLDEKSKTKTRRIVHLSFTGIFLIFLMLFHWMDNKTIIDLIIKLAGFTYGPLLGLFIFGIYTKRNIHRWTAPIVAVTSPSICYFLTDFVSKKWDLLGGYQFGYEILFLNAIITLLGLYFGSKKSLETENSSLLL